MALFCLIWPTPERLRDCASRFVYKPEPEWTGRGSVLLFYRAVLNFSAVMIRGFRALENLMYMLYHRNLDLFENVCWHLRTLHSFNAMHIIANIFCDSDLLPKNGPFKDSCLKH